MSKKKIFLSSLVGLTIYLVFINILIGLLLGWDIVKAPWNFISAEVLFEKGAGLGTILAFMMSVTTLSLPSLIMLRKAVKPKLLFWFIGIAVLGIMIIGFIFNVFSYIFM